MSVKRLRVSKQAICYIKVINLDYTFNSQYQLAG